MSAAAVAALAVTVVLVLALAFYLIWIVAILNRLVATLGKVTFGVGAIAHRLEPLEPLVGDMRRDLTQVAEAMEALATDLERPPGEVAS
jgi:hypothetical protein